MSSIIEIQPDVCSGKPVVIGTRVTVSTVLSYLSAGDSIESILEAHPELTREMILACLDYARRLGDMHVLVQKAS
ncbi:MAG: DUF433 domain-containing protein [Verrucomicrobia bacterium]|nr:DUF433 domain-containing protein [Verrucomicrobiota bacterium]